MDHPSIPPVISNLNVPPVISTPNFWKKRLLSFAFVIAIVSGVAWATTPRARLSRPADEVVVSVVPSILATAKEVDLAIDREIELRKLPKAEQADWHTIARRLSLALIGNSLSLEEVRVLEQIPEQDRISWWTDYLLRDRRSADYLAERWTRATVGTNNGPFLLFRRRKYVDWMADQLEQNKPFDTIVRKLICSQGSWTDAPEVNFLTATMDDADNKKPDAVRLAGRTSRAFLAQRIDCLQCHQDYLGKVGFTDQLQSTDEVQESDSQDQRFPTNTRPGEQADFHQLAAFFSGVRMENPLVGLRNKPTDYRIKYLNEDEETAVTPAVPYRHDLLPDHGSPRERLAAWVTHPENRAFARSTVNRVWAMMFGKAIVEPVDSIPLSGRLPESLEILANDFSRHGYDLQRLIRTIACTEVFRRDSRMDDESGIEIDQRFEQCWAVYPLSQLRPEQVAASIHQASRIKAIDQSSSIVSQLELFDGVNDFTKAYGDRGEDEFSEQSVTIPQRLLVMNGSFVSERIKNNPVMNAATRIAELTRDDRAAVTSAYLCTLNRHPTDVELTAFCEQLHGKRGRERSQLVGSMFWTLFNCTEFQWNH
jgi:hypothetical protein